MALPVITTALAVSLLRNFPYAYGRLCD